MEKPLSIKREEFVEAIVRAVNGCGLPPCVALEVMRSATAEVAMAAQKQLEADRAAYKEEADEQ